MKTLLLLGALAGWPLAYCQAQYHDALAESQRDPSAFGYGKRTRDDRYEGLYMPRVGVPPLQVVSVTQGPVAYELADDHTLLITASKSAAYQQVAVLASSFGLAQHYRLDAQVAAGGQRRIPLRDVLRPSGILSRNLGVFGYLGPPSSPTLYVPVQASDTPPTDGREIRILLLPGTTLDKLTWQYAHPQQGTCAQFVAGNTLAPNAPMGRFAAQRPVALVLVPGTGFQRGEELCVSVSYKVSGDAQWRTENLKVLMPN